MKYETIKSLILTVLVVTSVVLTWNLWTHQPKYEFIDKKIMHEVSISEPKEGTELIKPMRVLFHMDGQHYGTVEDGMINKLLDDLSTWSLYGLTTEKVDRSPKQVKELYESTNHIEFVFPDVIPFELYKGILHIEVEGEELPPASFDRIIIQFDQGSHEMSSIYFFATEEGILYKSSANKQLITSLLEEVQHDLNNYDHYEKVTFTGGQEDFLPAEPIELPRYKYLSDYIDPERFQNALFSDPGFVRRDVLTDGENFTDGSALMKVNYTTNMIFYINPSHELEPGIALPNRYLLEQSINFVNDHAGWTDQYRYFKIAAANQEVVFRLFMKGYPVFNPDGMAEIKQSWGRDKIYQYRRPYFILDAPLPEQTKVVLPTGQQALDKLKSDPDFQMKLLEKLLIGYKLTIEPDNPKVLALEPTWYYYYDGSWQCLDLKEEGDLYGLE